jgi:Fic family protein
MDWALYDQESAMVQRYVEIDERTHRLRDDIRHSALGISGFDETYAISLIFHENGLEGVVLGYAEIKSAVDNKIVSDTSLLPMYERIKNQKYCIDTMRERGRSKRFVVTIPFLKELHAKLVEDPRDAGVYRKDIPIHRTYFHEIAQPAKIETALTQVLNYLKARHGKSVHPIELAANVHHRFMRVFPFSDHSGTIGRLLGNFVLTRAGYLPVIIHASDRQRYYEALRASERDFRNFVAEAMENSLDNAHRFFSTQGETTPMPAMRPRLVETPNRVDNRQRLGA